ncbi:MAG: hypothetical protein H7210_06430 [Pyrinomonadaceae bacterium]|nr:hypothetical protein [Phycisphaerales bacterium]
MTIKMNRSVATLFASALCCVLLAGGCEKKPEAGKVTDTTKRPTTDKVNDALKDAKNKAVDEAHVVKDKAADLADKGKTAVVDAAVTARDRIVEAADASYKEATSQLEAFRKNVSDVSDPAKKTIFQKALEGIETQYQSLGDQLTKLRNTPPADAPVAGTEFTAMVDRLTETIKSTASKIIGK